MNRSSDKGNDKLRRVYIGLISKQLRKIFLSLFVVSALTILYVKSFHRVQSLNDLSQIYNVITLPNHDHRCKTYNNSHFICLPNVFLIGASKCGTTSMMDYLIQHPRIDHVRRRIHEIDKHREVHRFDRNTYGWASRTVEQYDEWASCPIISDPNMAVIHYTPHYLYAPSVPFEIKRFFPESAKLKFIVILRDPVERSLSSYWFQNSHIFNSQDQGSIVEFMNLARSEISLREKYEDCLLRRGGKKTNSSMKFTRLDAKAQKDGKSIVFQSPDLHSNALKFCFGSLYRDKSLGSRHIDKGIYHDQIQRWFDNFPSRNFLFISSKRFQKNPTIEYRRLLDFIFGNSTETENQNISPHPHPVSHAVTDANISSTVLGIMLNKKKLVRPNLLSVNGTPPEKFLEDLRKYYEPYNDELIKYVGRDFL